MPRDITTAVPPVLSPGRRWRLSGLIVNGFLQGLCAIGIAATVRLIFNAFSKSSAHWTIAEFGAIAAALLLLNLVVAGLRYFERTGAERLGQDYAYDVRKALYDHMANLTIRAQRASRHGNVFLRFAGDLTALRQWVSLGVARLVVAAVMTSVILTIMMIEKWELGLIVAGALVVGASLSFWRGFALERAVRDTRRRRSFLTANISEKISQMHVVQAYGQVKPERRRLMRQARRLVAASVHRAAIIGEMRGIVSLTTGLSIAGIVLVSALLVPTGQITAGDAVAAITLVSVLTPQIRDIGRVYEFWQAARVSREKVARYLNTGPALVTQAKAEKLSNPYGAIEFKNVSVDGSLKAVNGLIPSGAKVAITGKNGAGKSTLLFLLQRLIDPNEGEITIGGQDISRVSLQDVRTHIAIASPDLALLRGTVDTNLRYRNPDASDADVEDVCKHCGVDVVIKDLPNGLDTKVLEGGRNLSLGQRHRIALARALLGKPAVLLLDEAEANFDAGSREIIRRVVVGFEGIVLIVTHSDEWNDVATLNWHLEDGILVERRAAPRNDNVTSTNKAEVA